MKKFIAIFLILVMSATLLVACGENDVNNKGDNVSVNNDKASEYMNTDGEYIPKLEVKDLDGRDFTIIVRGSKSGGTYQSDDFTTDSELYGQLLNDAVQTRNDKVAAIYNVSLEVVKSDTIDEDIKNDIASMLGTYDAIMPTLSSLATFGSENLLVNLKDLENFDENAPWFDKNCTDAFSFGGKIFFTTGDITILNKVCTPSILFSKDLVQKQGLDNPYELVKSKQWTFDKMVEMAKQVKVINTSDGSYSDTNIYGMVSAYGDALSFYGASGELICAKDGDDIPYLSIGSSQRSINIAQKVLNTLTSGDWICFAQEFSGDIWEESFAVFYEGRALFRPSAFSATTKLRSRSTSVFGILPVPLMDETQEEYCSYCGTNETAGFAIPISAKDPEFSMYMIDAYSAWAKNTITKAYYEINLKTKDARDDESEEMLDIIFENKVYDIGGCYNFGDFKGMFYSLMANKSSDVVSAIEARKENAQNAINEVKESYED